MDPDVIVNHCLERLDGIVAVESWGERGIFYNPDGRLKRGVYVLTIKEKDGDNDCSSQLDRQGVWRVNIGVRKSTFRTMFGEIPARPPKGGTVDAAHDFSALDCIMPHPVYAWMGWICVLNPTERTFDVLRPLIDEAYAYAKEKYGRRMRKG